jgi:tetratricopeptide (TPR) repeat protein
VSITPLLLAPGTVLGRFRLVALLGRGGMGEVWLAEDDGVHVALKVLGTRAPISEESARRFERERDVLDRVAHPAIVRALGPLDSDAARGLRFFPMELVLGKSLADLLVEHGRFPVVEALRILRELASALEVVHAAGVVHRDVKPSNVLLDRSRRVRLTDFGLARVLDESALTADGRALGTPLYMAPEQARGTPAVAASDLYATGALAHELLGGRPPFAAESPLVLLRMQVEERPTPLRSLRPEVPEELEFMVLRLLDKDPSARPGAGALRDELDALHARLAPEAVTFADKVAAGVDRDTASLVALKALASTRGRPVARKERRRIGVTFALGVALGGLAVPPAIFWWPRGATAPKVKTSADEIVERSITRLARKDWNALADMKLAIELDEQCLSFYATGRLYQTLGRRPEAVEFIARALEREPRNGQVLWALANAQFANGETTSTLALADRLFAIGDPRGYLARANVRSKKNDLPGAIADLNAFLDLGWSEEIMLTRARREIKQIEELEQKR